MFTYDRSLTSFCLLFHRLWFICCFHILYFRTAMLQLNFIPSCKRFCPYILFTLHCHCILCIFVIFSSFCAFWLGFTKNRRSSCRNNLSDLIRSVCYCFICTWDFLSAILDWFCKLNFFKLIFFSSVVPFFSFNPKEEQINKTVVLIEGDRYTSLMFV